MGWRRANAPAPAKEGIAPMQTDRNWSSWQSTRFPGIYLRQRVDGRAKTYAIDYVDGNGHRRRKTVAGGLAAAKRERAAITSKAQKDRPRTTNMTLAQMFE